MHQVASNFIHSGAFELQDRAEILNARGRLLFTVADGSGGIAGGTMAAELFIKRIRESAELLTTPDTCRNTLAEMDRILRGTVDCGETTGVIVVASPTHDVSILTCSLSPAHF